MPGRPESTELPPTKTAEVETLIFLDVDGVLNIGVSDPGNSALLLNDANLEYARKIAHNMNLLPRSVRDNVIRIGAAAAKNLPHGDKTLGDLACPNDLELCEELVRRLAILIKNAGSKVEVILASTWRLPKYHQRVRKLELMLAKHLHRDFSFDRRTRLCHEPHGVDRLVTIGEHMATLGNQRDRSLPLRVLVLDDFCITSFKEGRMDINGQKVRSPEAAADYICKQYAGSASDSAPIKCAVIHTYDDWSERGVRVQVGCGLTLEHVCEAATFLGHSCPSCSCQSDEDKCTAVPDSSDELSVSDDDSPSARSEMAPSLLDVPSTMYSSIVSLLRRKRRPATV